MGRFATEQFRAAIDHGLDLTRGIKVRVPRGKTCRGLGIPVVIQHRGELRSQVGRHVGLLNRHGFRGPNPIDRAGQDRLLQRERKLEHRPAGEQEPGERAVVGVVYRQVALGPHAPQIKPLLLKPQRIAGELLACRRVNAVAEHERRVASIGQRLEHLRQSREPFQVRVHPLARPRLRPLRRLAAAADDRAPILRPRGPVLAIMVQLGERLEERHGRPAIKLRKPLQRRALPRRQKPIDSIEDSFFVRCEFLDFRGGRVLDQRRERRHVGRAEEPQPRHDRAHVREPLRRQECRGAVVVDDQVGTYVADQVPPSSGAHGELGVVAPADVG